MEREVARARVWLRLDALVCAAMGGVLVFGAGPVAARFGAGGGGAAAVGALLLVWALDLGVAATARPHWIRTATVTAMVVNGLWVAGMLFLLARAHPDAIGIALAVAGAAGAGAVAAAQLDAVTTVRAQR